MMMTATLLLIAMILCAIYLTVDRVVDEIRRDRDNKRELEHWNAAPPKQYEPTRKTKNRA